MLAFDRTFKIYLFKDKNMVDLTIRVADNYAHTYQIDKADLENLLANWREPLGYSFKFGHNRANIQHKKSTPRPISAPADYMRFTVYTTGVQYQYRFDAVDVEQLQKDFEYQCNNVMFWDND
jgi:hypothetical protein